MWLCSDEMLVDVNDTGKSSIQVGETMMLETWLSVALERELRRTSYIKTPDQALSKNAHGVSDISFADVTSNTVKTDRLANAEMPFRGNNAESVFIS